jgi:hypothetical protein
VLKSRVSFHIVAAKARARLQAFLKESGFTLEMRSFGHGVGASSGAANKFVSLEQSDQNRFRVGELLGTHADELQNLVQNKTLSLTPFRGRTGAERGAPQDFMKVGELPERAQPFLIPNG